MFSEFYEILLFLNPQIFKIPLTSSSKFCARFSVYLRTIEFNVLSYSNVRYVIVKKIADPFVSTNQASTLLKYKYFSLNCQNVRFYTLTFFISKQKMKH